MPTFISCSTQYISRIFIKTEMLLKSRSVLTSGSKQLIKSRSSDNLPTSQSQVNIQMMSHTLTIREVCVDNPLIPLFDTPPKTHHHTVYRLYTRIQTETELGFPSVSNDPR